MKYPILIIVKTKYITCYFHITSDDEYKLCYFNILKENFESIRWFNSNLNLDIKKPDFTEDDIKKIPNSMDKVKYEMLAELIRYKNLIKENTERKKFYDKCKHILDNNLVNEITRNMTYDYREYFNITILEETYETYETL